MPYIYALKLGQAGVDWATVKACAKYVFASDTDSDKCLTEDEKSEAQIVKELENDYGETVAEYRKELMLYCILVMGVAASAEKEDVLEAFVRYDP